MFRLYIGKKGFTLVEMLIVIVIIGILASALAPRVIGLQDKARITHTKRDLQLIASMIQLAHLNTSKPIMMITQNNCTYCGTFQPWIGGGAYPKNLVTIFPEVWKNSITRIAAAAEQQGLAEKLYTDPWGMPYFLDENEGEVSNNGGNLDNLFSFGPDTWIGGGDDIIGINRSYGMYDAY